LPALHARGYLLGIASNFDGRLHGIVRGLPDLAACERTFVSSEIGWTKPDPRFFAAVQERLAAQPHEILLVGDDWEADILGARAAGWQAAFLAREGAPKGHAALASLDELLGLLPDLHGTDR
jgi:FMN phosphatase YigB (HAD superfamily)